MSLSASDLQGLLALVREHTEWCEALRREVLTEDLLALPGTVREAQARTEARFAELAAAQQRTEAKVAELAAAQQRTEAKVAELAAAQQRTEARVAELAAAQQRTEAKVAELAGSLERLSEEVTRLSGEVAKLTGQVSHLDGRMGNLEGMMYEQRFRDHVGSRLGRLLRRATLVSLGHLDAALDAMDRGDLDEREWDQLVALDLLVRGRKTSLPADAPDQFLAIELSLRVDARDVARAHERAGLLRRIGLPAAPLVCGRDITPDAAHAAQALGVAVLLDRPAS